MSLKRSSPASRKASKLGKEAGAERRQTSARGGDACFSEDILEEYASVLARPKFAFPPDEIAAVLAMFHNQGELFQPDVSGPVSSDPADTKFLHCAQAAQADYIVTGNKRDFPDAPYGVTRVLSAGELLDQITFEI
jgi:predicted nucleic acid-binding protein